MQLERAFIDPQGLPGRPLARYTITKNSIQLYVKEHFRLYTKFLSIFWLVFFSLLRHVLFAESSVNTYAGSSFPGLADGMFEIEDSPDKASRWEIVKKHFAVILYTIESAASTLRDVHKFMPL